MDDDLLTHMRRLLAKEQITDALLNYARGADRLDLDLIRSTFHPGAIADYGDMFQGTGEEFAEFIGQVHPPMQTHTHHLSNISITVTESAEGNAEVGRAGSECYVLVRTRTLGEDGAVHDNIAHGRYVDQWERRDGRWRIAHRRYLHSLDEIAPVEMRLFAPAGSRDSSDPSYAVLAGRGDDPQPA